MVSAFASFPEVLTLDATYKLNNFRMPLYDFLAVVLMVMARAKLSPAASRSMKHEQA